jgi:hypothetical protein
MRLLPLLGVAGLWALLGCDEPGLGPEVRAELENRTREVKRFEKGLSSIGQQAPGPVSSCPDGPIRKAVATSQNRRALFADQHTLKAAAAGKPLEGASPLAAFTSRPLLRRKASASIQDPQSATQAAFDVVSLHKSYDFLVVPGSPRNSHSVFL